jgi:hypothetical protein
MMRGLAMAGPRPAQGIEAQIKNTDIEDVSQLGVELLRAVGSWVGSTAVDSSKSRPSRDVDRRSGGERIPAVRGTEIERQSST